MELEWKVGQFTPYQKTPFSCFNLLFSRHRIPECTVDHDNFRLYPLCQISVTCFGHNFNFNTSVQIQAKEVKVSSSFSNQTRIQAISRKEKLNLDLNHCALSKQLNLILEIGGTFSLSLGSSDICPVFSYATHPMFIPETAILKSRFQHLPNINLKFHFPPSTSSPSSLPSYHEHVEMRNSKGFLTIWNQKTKISHSLPDTKLILIHLTNGWLVHLTWIRISNTTTGRWLGGIYSNSRLLYYLHVTADLKQGPSTPITQYGYGPIRLCLKGTSAIEPKSQIQVQKMVEMELEIGNVRVGVVHDILEYIPSIVRWMIPFSPKITQSSSSFAILKVWQSRQGRSETFHGFAYIEAVSK